ncbi:MAG: alpha-galactosidase [Candidatus Sumerlaeaceae bacterium]
MSYRFSTLLLAISMGGNSTAESRIDSARSELRPVVSDGQSFSFHYDSQPFLQLLPSFKSETVTAATADYSETTTTWASPTDGLCIVLCEKRYLSYNATDWLLSFENRGTTPTGIIEDVLPLDMHLPTPAGGQILLHRTRGAPSNPTDFEPSVMPVIAGAPIKMESSGGRSSNGDFPFFKIEVGELSWIVAVGWSGGWQATVEPGDGTGPRVRAGMYRTKFRVLPGERLRGPRILLFADKGKTIECNARFRELIYAHYAAKRSGKTPLPTPFSNTCFTRLGEWLNECNAENQISLIRAYAPLGLEALITDAGWFEGGWPGGAGNWTPRRDAYPDGMKPVAASAAQNGLIYGLWFEPERVMSGTGLHRDHPDWLLTAKDAQGHVMPQYLADFGRSEVRNYFFSVVKGFMDLPGFRFYRQDFNMDPIQHWIQNDSADRVGVTEMHYIQGLYTYWERIAEAWPDSLREECASGGRRIDLETISRMHFHQDSDYWFDDDTDQAQIWGLSQYLPNSVFTTPLTRLDDYSFHSTMASSLCLGWIADAKDFDSQRARTLIDQYKKLRHLLVGAWYPLLPYVRSGWRGDERPSGRAWDELKPYSGGRTQWMAYQFHRRDLDEGIIFAFRREASQYSSADLSLHGLRAEARYCVTHAWPGGPVRQATGAELMQKFQVTLPTRRTSELIHYRLCTAEDAR